MTIDILGPGWQRVGGFDPFASGAAGLLPLVVAPFIIGLFAFLLYQVVADDSGSYNTEVRASTVFATTFLVLFGAVVAIAGHTDSKYISGDDLGTPLHRYERSDRVPMDSDNPVYQQRVATAVKDTYGLRKVKPLSGDYGLYAKLDGTDTRECLLRELSSTQTTKRLVLMCNGTEPAHVTRGKP